MDRIQRQNTDYARRYIEGIVLKQDPICLKIFDSLAEVVEGTDSDTRGLTSTSIVTTQSIGIVSSKCSSDEMHEKLIYFTKQSAPEIAIEAIKLKQRQKQKSFKE